MLMRVMCIISCISVLSNEPVYSRLVSAVIFSPAVSTSTWKKWGKLGLQRCVNVAGLALTSASC